MYHIILGLDKDHLKELVTDNVQTVNSIVTSLFAC